MTYSTYKNFKGGFYVAVLCLLCNLSYIGAQNIKFSNISIKSGLSQSSPNCIFQDSRGIMWIGTEDGLNKYDGYGFTVYKPQLDDPYSISNSRILTIAEDSLGNLWVGTSGGGLNKYNRNENRFYPVQSDGSELSAVTVVNSVINVNHDEFWVGTNVGLFQFNISQNKYIDIIKTFPSLSALKGVSVHTILADQENIWVGTSSGLYRFDRKTGSLNHYLHNPDDNNSLRDNNITALLVDRNQNLIIGSETGISLMTRDGLFTRFQLNGNVGSIKSLLEDSDGNIWIATFGSGLYIGSFQTGEFINYGYDHLNPYSIKNNEVLSLFEDYSGLIWVGTNGIDIYRPKKEKFVLYDYVPYSREQLIFRNIHPIYEDQSRVLWIGSKTDGLHILDRKNRAYSRLTQNHSQQNSLSSSKVRAIKEFPNGTLWVGTENAGIDRITLNDNRKPVSIKNYKHQPGNANSLTSNKIYALHGDDSGNLWIGTDNGLTVMNISEETFTQYVPDKNVPESISNTTVYAIFGDVNNNIWLATDLGVNKFDPALQGFIHYVHEDGNDNSIIHNEILCFHEDRAGKLWIGTYGKGFDKFDPVNNKFTHFSDIPEVSTAVIYGILEDTHGNLWMSTNNGIHKFNEKTRELKQFTIEDGLQSNEFNGTSYFLSNSGEMFFGGQFGFNGFYPDEVQVDTIVPKIILSDLQVHNQSIVPGENSPINKEISEASEIVLDYKQNNFTLYFSALHFANPTLNRYKYKLEGFDKDWIDAGTKRFVSYTNLPYKAYKFRVIASNSDGVWNVEGLSVRIRVKPPIWATLWFRILMIFAIIGTIGFVVRRRLTLKERQKRLIEEKFHNSSKELEEARIQLDKQHEEIVLQKRELVTSQKDQENLLWFNQGLGLFSDLISKNRENLTELCKEFIEKLVDYVDAQQGGIFLLNDDEAESTLEMVASYAISASRFSQKFAIGEGYIGACFKDKKFIEIDNISENYSELNSGLGKMSIKHLILAPLVVNHDCIGVVEIGSFKKIKGYRISFIEKLVETCASTILTEQANARLKKLIEQSTRQASELTMNEEQMRKNFEELMAAQEESSKREDELILLAEESATREEMLQQEIEMLKNQLGKKDEQSAAN